MRNKVKERDWLRIFRTHLEYSLMELAQEVGVSKTALSLYEKGLMTPREGVAHMIGDVLGFDGQMFYEEVSSK